MYIYEWKKNGQQVFLVFAVGTYAEGRNKPLEGGRGEHAKLIKRPREENT